MITPAYSPTATERVLPRMALDFTTGMLDPRVTITRALNTATCVNSSGFIEIVNANLPRFDYDPLTLAPKGLLIEEARTNSILQSETFSTTWANFGFSLDKSYAAPDGQNNATKIIPDNATTLANNALQQNVSKAASSITYTCSIFAKAGEFNRLRILVRDVATGNNFARATFNLGTKTVSDGPTAGGTFSAASVSYQDASNGFIRYCLTFTTGTETSIRPVLIVFDSVATTGNGTSGIYAYGAQLEAGAFATSYIPTTTTSLTRNADRVSMTGTNFSSWYNASEGTIAVQGDTLTVSNSGSMTICSLLLNSSNVTRFWMWSGQPANLRYGVVASGATSADIAKAITANTRFNAVGSYKTNLFQYALNAGATTADISGAVPTGLTAFYIGSLDSVNEPLSGHIAKINFYPQSLTSNEVQAFSK
jgi:hypothetical protein